MALTKQPKWIQPDNTSLEVNTLSVGDVIQRSTFTALSGLSGVMRGSNNLSDVGSDDIAIRNLVTGATQETSIVGVDEMLMYDTSGSNGGAITYGDFMGQGKVIFANYIGNGLSGRLVTLTGINRAHHIYVFNRFTILSSAVQHEAMPQGDIGNIRRRDLNDGNTPIVADWALSAPSAGSDQILTINNTLTTEPGALYGVKVIGVPS